MLYHTALPSLYSTELPTRIPAPSEAARHWKRRLHQELAAASRSHRATVELSRELLLQQWSGPPTVAVTNLELCCCCCCCVAGRIILILQLLPTLGLGGVAGSCLVIVTSGCLVSVLNQSFSGVRFSSEVQSISPLSSCSTYTAR
jgi:hypothetical protein